MSAKWHYLGKSTRFWLTSRLVWKSPNDDTKAFQHGHSNRTTNGAFFLLLEPWLLCSISCGSFPLLFLTEMAASIPMATGMSSVQQMVLILTHGPNLSTCIWSSVQHMVPILTHGPNSSTWFSVQHMVPILTHGSLLVIS